MGMAADLSLELNLIGKEDRDRIVALIGKAGLPTKLKMGDPDTSTLYAACFKDKKVAAGKLRFIVAERIGSAKTVTDVPEAMVRKVFDAGRE
jgi:3-dehydroquinate synthase